MTKTVFITVFHSFVSKNILNSGVLSGILDNSNANIVLLVPENKKDFFSEIYASDRVKVEGVQVSRISNYRSVKFFLYLSRLLLSGHYLWYKKVEKRDQKNNPIGWLVYFLEIVFTAIFSKIPMMPKAFRYLFSKIVRIDEVKRIFKKYNLEALFSTDIFDESDILFENEARTLGIPILGMVRSWDNCYSKGILRVAADYFLANNPTIQEELITIHRISPEKIKVVGVPQYDYFINSERTNKESFMNKIGLSVGKKTILFAPAGTILSDKDGEICEILINAIKEKKIKFPAQIFVRNHPNHPADLSKFENSEFFKVEYPGKVFGNNPKETELTKNDTSHLADTLCYSDVVIYTATTLGIDSLCFDKPQIIINFDGYKNKPYEQSVKRYYNEDHMKKMIACGGVSMANSLEELISEINKYLENPKYRFEGREKMRKQQIYFMDGKSNERVTAEILDFISK